MKVRIDHFPHGDLFIYRHLRKCFNFNPEKVLSNFIQPFEHFHVPYILGVSPAILDRTSGIPFLKSLQYAEVAMLGFSHGWLDFKDKWNLVEDYYSSGGEFSFDSKSMIYEKIVKGLYILSDFNVDTFIAPFHVYSQNLLDVLNILGFKRIMTGENTIAFGMDKLDHGDLDLDICVPPYFGTSKKIIPHLSTALEYKQTIGLQWIYEKHADAKYWYTIAKTINQNGCKDHSDTIAQNISATKKEKNNQTVRFNELMKIPISIVTETLNYVSGGVRCIVEVLNDLSRRGYQVSCHVTKSDVRCEWLDIEFPILTMKEFSTFQGIAVSPFSPTAEIVARSNAMAKFYWVHSYEPKFPELTGRSEKWRIMSEKSYQHDQLLYFAVSNYVRMILELIYKRDVLSPLVPGGVDTKLFKPGEKTGCPLKVMFLSREHSFRGSQDIVNALKLIQADDIEVDVYVMGNEIDIEGFSCHHFSPLPQEDFAHLLGKMDVFIHASHFEGLPLPPLEAMACGCAVIATPIGASDYLLDGFNAIVVPPKKPQKIAEAIKLLHDDKSLREDLQRHGLETVRRNYTWEHTTDRFLEALEEGMSRIAPPPLVSGAHQPQQPVARLDGGQRDTCRVSAIVSTFNAQRFLRGCLEDLERQTIAKEMEIIVVNSGSEQDEAAIVREFQATYQNIKYIETDNRETVYQAWNRAIRAAGGKYITNANADDRHAPHAMEYMAGVLDATPDVALVYADVWVTQTENETYDRFTPVGKFQWQAFNPATLYEACYIGPQPMWRRRLHETHGLFDETLESAGDWEFWLRIAKTETFYHIPKLLGLYLDSPVSVEHRDPTRTTNEVATVRNRYAPYYRR